MMQDKATWMRRWRERNPDKVKAYAEKAKYRGRALNQRYHLKSEFGLETPQIVVDMIAAQGGCAICHKPLAFPHKHTHVDHDPTKKNRVRGILCHHCNVGLGHFRDRPDLLKKAAEYLIFYSRPKAN